jgi:hypothetical protein
MRNRRIGRGAGIIKAQGGDIVAPKAFNRAQAVQQEKAALYAQAGVITTPGYLRLEVSLTGTTNLVAFQVRDAQGGTQHVTERRLKVSDSFTIMAGAFYIGKAAATASVVSNAQYGAMTLHTFPNPQVFTGGTAAANLQTLYNGYLSVRVDSTVFIDSMPMLNFYRVATSQQGVGSSATNNIPIQADEWPLSMYGNRDWTPTIELNGLANTEININLPTSVNLAAGANTYETNAVLYLTGFLNQGGASVQQSVQRALKSGGRLGEFDEDFD